MDERDPLPGFDDRAPQDRYCDLILTGGVTSAIAYPAAVFLLGQAYRFNAIGGASSGAGAAALAAAAEYRRRHGSPQGFQTLAQRIAAIADECRGRTNLSRLFQPTKGNERLFNAVLRFVAWPEHRFGQLVRDAVTAYGASMWRGAGYGGLLIAVTTWPFLPAGWPAVLLAVLLVALLFAVLWLVQSIWSDVLRLADQDYGLCDGISHQPDEKHPPLTEWLHKLIQEIAGRGPDDPPLTFGDLQRAPGSPAQTLGDAGPAGARSIHLEMIVANVSLGEPVRFPRTDDDTPLYFRCREMLRLFPPSVVGHMVECAAPYAGAGGHPSDDFYELPRLDLPIVVAARMSVSFPVLFAPVPLWRLDRSLSRPRLRRCLMFDGGLCSNFPIHLFDSLVPAWPTFGIQLRDPERVRSSARGRGQAPRWHAFDEQATATARLGGLAAAMLATMKDWTDATQARLPGVRDRVVTIGLRPGIGGLNILMTGEQIRWLARRGARAALRLLKRFSKPNQASGQAAGWDEHRRMRFRLACESLRRCVGGLTAAAAARRHATPLRELLADDGSGAPAPARMQRDSNQAFGPPLRADQIAALEGALEALEQLEASLAARATTLPKPPHPQPELCVRPPM